MKHLILVIDDNPSDFEKIMYFIGDAYRVCPYTEQKLEKTRFRRYRNLHANGWNHPKQPQPISKIRQAFGDICMVWMSAREQDAVDAFEHHADAFLQLPPTEKTVSDVAKRLLHISCTRDKARGGRASANKTGPCSFSA